MKFPFSLSATLACALVATLGLHGCGGSSADTTPKVNITSVKVFGDSLADSGVFGFKFTVQGASPTTPYAIWPELAAASYGVTGLCPRYMATGATTVALNPGAATCSSYAVGGGRVNNPTAPTAGFSIRQQMADAATDLGVATYKATDLILIDGGGNDAADLTGAYLGVASGGLATYQGLLSSILPAATVNAYLATGAAGVAGVGTPYMQALADAFYASIKTNVLDKGAQRVVVLNAPAITNTPRFKMVLQGVAAAYGGGAAGTAAAAQVEGLVKTWVSAFNAQLASKLAGDSRVVVVDFYTEFNNQVANPAQYGLTDAALAACPVTALGADGLPEYNFPACTATALSASQSAKPNWWKTHAFSDGFHPTPYGHQLLAQLIARSLASAGWL
jgi:outer membrane lipase/esterase